MIGAIGSNIFTSQRLNATAAAQGLRENMYGTMKNSNVSSKTVLRENKNQMMLKNNDLIAFAASLAEQQNKEISNDNIKRSFSTFA